MKASLDQIAKVKAGTHFVLSEIAEKISGDEELKAGRLIYSSKQMLNAEKEFDKATDRIMAANDRLLKAAKEIEDQSKKACRSVKSTVNEIKDQLIKVDSILGDNVEHKIKQLERVASALKTISELSNDNQTMKIVSAMVNR